MLCFSTFTCNITNALLQNIYKLIFEREASF